MPLTPAHAAAALPIHWATGRRLPLAALVMGTLAPDFEYLLRLAPRGHFAHSALGLFIFDLPLGLAVYAAFTRLVRPALLDLLPRGLAAAADGKGSKAGRGLRLGAAAIAVVLGAASHILWDGFTHDPGWAVAQLPALRAPVLPELLPHLRWYKALQHGSTLLGGTVVLAWALRWLRRQPAAAFVFGPGQALRAWRAAAVLLGIAAIAGVANGLRGLHRGFPIALGFAAVGVMSGLAVAVLAYGLWHLRAGRGHVAT